MRLLVALALLSAACSRESASSKPFAPPPQVPAETASADDPALARARGFVQLLADGKHGEAVAMFDTTMTSAMDAAALKATWADVVARVGAFEAIEGARVERAGAHRVVLVTVKHAAARLDVKVVLDAKQQVAGLFFVPAQTPYSDPPYVDRNSFDEVDLVLESGEWAMPGTLSVPRRPKPAPAVVLVHGSGPHDRDQTIAVNKPFKDLAGGLASRGIAVFRYEKRTKVHGARMAKLADTTIDHEAVDDAVAAVEMLRNRSEIDSQRIVVVGHSLGGFVAPRIGSRSKHVAAIAILAGSTRSIPDMMIEQLEYIATVDPQQAPAIPQAVEQVKATGTRIRELQLGAKPRTGEQLLGAGPAYWIDLAKYDAPAVAKTFPRPIFVAAGGRDYQVTRVDFDAWKGALGDRQNVTFKLYDDLNHILAAGSGKSAPKEYAARTPVDSKLIDDLARWISSL